MRLLKLAGLMLSAMCIYAQTPAVFDGGVGNAAAPTSGVTPGSLVSIYGTELAAGLSQADSVPLATVLSDVSVSFNDVPASLLFVSGGQINAQLPWNVLPQGTLAGQASVTVRRGGVVSQSQPVQVVEASPAIFTFPAGGNGWAIAINPDGSLASPVGAIAGIATRPVIPGEALVILATGFGAVDSPVENGHDSLDKLRRTVITPVVTVGGVQAEVLFSGLAPQFPGVNQLNIIVPNGVAAGDNVPVNISFNGVASPAGAIIAVKAP